MTNSLNENQYFLNIFLLGPIFVYSTEKWKFKRDTLFYMSNLFFPRKCTIIKNARQFSIFNY